MYTILIVDDDVYIGDMLEEILAGEGYKTARAYSGTEALMYLSASRPDLVLLDLMLPGLSGEELLPLIKGIPVIVVSARAETSDKVDLLLGGASDYVTKPFDTAELLARIAVQLRKGVSSDSGSVLAFRYHYSDSRRRAFCDYNVCNILYNSFRKEQTSLFQFLLQVFSYWPSLLS